jgi:hypothetical protein
MAHHQGMSLLAIANLLHGGVFQQWFHREAKVEATELLLQEQPAVYAVKPAGARSKQRAELLSAGNIPAKDELVLAS